MSLDELVQNPSQSITIFHNPENTSELQDSYTSLPNSIVRTTALSFMPRCVQRQCGVEDKSFNKSDALATLYDGITVTAIVGTALYGRGAPIIASIGFGVYCSLFIAGPVAAKRSPLFDEMRLRAGPIVSEVIALPFRGVHALYKKARSNQKQLPSKTTE